jgi:hypothetical protein
LEAFAKKAATERGFERMTHNDAVLLLLTIYDHMPPDTVLEE